jgi:hypothetical protein
LQVQAPARQLQLLTDIQNTDIDMLQGKTHLVTPQVHCSVLLLDMMVMMVSAVKLQDGVSPSWSDLRQTTHLVCETVDNGANCWRKSQPKRGHFILLTVSAVSRSNHNGQMQKWKIKGCNCRYQSHVNTAPQGPPSEMTQKGQLLLQDKNLWHMHATI